jgi:hypothetical protein
VALAARKPFRSRFYEEIVARSAVAKKDADLRYPSAPALAVIEGLFEYRLLVAAVTERRQETGVCLASSPRLQVGRHFEAKEIEERVIWLGLTNVANVGMERGGRVTPIAR